MRHRAGAVPLSDDARAVAGRLQQAREERNVRRDAVAVAVEAETLLVTTAEEAGAGGTTERGGDVARGELNALLGKTIDVRRFHHIAEEAAHVSAAQVIDQHDNEVRLISSRQRGS